MYLLLRMYVRKFKDYTFRTERSKYLRDMCIPLNTDSTVNMIFDGASSSDIDVAITP